MLLETVPGSIRNFLKSSGKTCLVLCHKGVVIEGVVGSRTIEPWGFGRGWSLVTTQRLVKHDFNFYSVNPIWVSLVPQS